MGRGVDDHLLPDRPPETILQVVDLVEYDRVHGGQIGAGVNHVAEHFGGHHHDRGVMVDDVIAGEQTDPLAPVNLPEVAELLVGEGFQGGGVEHPFGVGQAQMDSRLGDQGLTGTGRGGNHHRLAHFHHFGRLHLKGVRGEREGIEEGMYLHFLRVRRISQMVPS